jgi:nicotinamide mononucleotide transporter
MTKIELIAAVLGAVSVWFVVRRNVWAFPIGIVMVLIYAWIFYEARLYSDMLLQFFFAVMQVHGWYEWRRAAVIQTAPTDEQNVASVRDQDISTSKTTSRIAVRSLSGTQWGITVAAQVVGTVALGWTMGRYTDAALPYLDAFATMMSVLAQWWMNRRYLENWILWIAVDFLYLYIYTDRGLYYTTVLYAVFTVMAFLGHMEWKRTLEKQQKATTGG